MLNFLQHGLLFEIFGGAVAKEELLKYNLLYLGFTLLVIVAAYLLGSINTSIVISRLIYKDDIRKHGSGNAGLTNTLRTYGKGAAGLTLLGDILKTAIAILFAAIFFGFGYIGGMSFGGDGRGMCYIAGLFAVIGHIFPIYYKFKGGKGVLATATMGLILSPVPFLFLLLLFVIIVAISKYVSLGSIVGAIFYPVSLYVYLQIITKGVPLPLYCAIASIILAILIVFCHRENIERIQNRTERKLSFKKKPEVTLEDTRVECDDEEA